MLLSHRHYGSGCKRAPLNRASQHILGTTTAPSSCNTGVLASKSTLGYHKNLLTAVLSVEVQSRTPASRLPNLGA